MKNSRVQREEITNLIGLGPAQPAYIIKMEPDLQLGWMTGYSLDMLRDVLTIADYTSLHFFLDSCDTGVYEGIRFVYKQAYDRWAASGF